MRGADARIESLYRRNWRRHILRTAVVPIAAVNTWRLGVELGLGDLGARLDDFAAQAEHDAARLIVQLLLATIRHRWLLRRDGRLRRRDRPALELLEFRLVGGVLVVDLLDVVSGEADGERRARERAVVGD